MQFSENDYVLPVAGSEIGPFFGRDLGQDSFRNAFGAGAKPAAGDNELIGFHIALHLFQIGYFGPIQADLAFQAIHGALAELEGSSLESQL